MSPAATEVAIDIYKPISTSCIFAHLLRTPMRESAQTGVWLAFPRFVTNLEFHGSGYLFDNGTLDDLLDNAMGFTIEGEPIWVERPFLQQPSFDRRIYLRNETLLGEPTASITYSDDPGLLPKQVINSLLEVLKVVAMSDGTLGHRRNDPDRDVRLEPFGYESPHLIVNLLSCHLPILIERVSQRHRGL
jgi:hypothetical protein